MMIVGGAGVRWAGPFDGTPGGHIGSDQKRGGSGLRVFERQFPIDQFFM